MSSAVTKNYIPQIDYVSRDYTAILADLTAIAKQFNPTWAVSDPTDIGVSLLETFAYLGDILSFYTDRMASEGFLGTASQRASVLQIAAMLGYAPTPSSAAVVGLTFTNNDNSNPVTIAAGTRVASTTDVDGQSTQVIFETDSDLTLAAGATGSVTATQGITISNEQLGSSNGSPSQAFKLANLGVTINSTGSNISVLVGGVSYAYSSSLLDNNPYDAVFTTTMDADGYTYVVFGDGVGGKVPPATYSITATYRVGLGADGNVPAGSIYGSPITGSYNVTVSQPSASYGGAYAESTDSIRYNVPRALRTLRRAVSLKDYAYLALQVSGVSKASADSAVWSNVNLYIAPFGASAVNTYGPFIGNNASIVTAISSTLVGTTYQTTYTAAAGTFSALYSLPSNSTYVTVSGCSPTDYNLNTPTLVVAVAADGSSITVDTGKSTFATPTFHPELSPSLTITAFGTSTTAFNNLKTSVANYFMDKVAPNVSLNIYPPTYVPVNMDLTVHVLPQYSQASVVTQVQSALSDLVSYNNAFFADRLPPHFILNALTNIDGVDYATVEHLRRVSNEKAFTASYWVKNTDTAVITFDNPHTIVPGEKVRLSGLREIDGVYGVNSVTTNTITISIPTGTAGATSVTSANYGVGGRNMTGVTALDVVDATGVVVGDRLSGTGIADGTLVTSVGIGVDMGYDLLGLSLPLTGNVTNGVVISVTKSVRDSANLVRVTAVESTTVGGVETFGIVCSANEIPTKGTFTVTAIGGLL